MTPSFFVVGAARSATTSLHHYLDRHPQVVMSRTKEPNYFLFSHDDGRARPLVNEPSVLNKSVSERQAYQQLFDRVPPGGVAGEASPLYLYVRETPAMLAEAIPDVRAIAVLRDPIERAVSHHRYVHGAGNGDGIEAFRRAVSAEMTEPGYTPYVTGTHLLRLGRYGEQLARYREHIAPERLLVLEFGAVSADPASAMARICRFLGVDDTVTFDRLVAYNGSAGATGGAAGAAKATLNKTKPWLKRHLPARVVGPLAELRARRAKPAVHEGLPADLHRQLVDYFADDLAVLEPLVDFDLSRWPTAA